MNMKANAFQILSLGECDLLESLIENFAFGHHFRLHQVTSFVLMDYQFRGQYKSNPVGTTQFVT